MGKDIKNLMDDIIKDTDKRYNDEDESCYEKFDKDDYREKLSMFVLKDIISAMMANETDGLDGMIDESIMKHIHDDYKGTCFGYLCNARDKCKSPLLAEIIQEIESKTCEAAQECAITKNHCVVEAADVKKMLEGVEDYDQFIQKIASEVSERVVDDVAGLLTDGGGKAPTFKDLDEKIELTPEDNNVCISGKYAAHTGGGNTGSIGICYCGMYGYKSPKNCGNYPISSVQFEAGLQRCFLSVRTSNRCRCSKCKFTYAKRDYNTTARTISVISINQQSSAN